MGPNGRFRCRMGFHGKFWGREQDGWKEGLWRSIERVSENYENRGRI